MRFPNFGWDLPSKSSQFLVCNVSEMMFSYLGKMTIEPYPPEHVGISTFPNFPNLIPHSEMVEPMKARKVDCKDHLQVVLFIEELKEEITADMAKVNEGVCSWWWVLKSAHNNDCHIHLLDLVWSRFQENNHPWFFTVLLGQSRVLPNQTDLCQVSLATLAR